MQITNQKKFLFIDRDGTLIQEPADEQVDSLNKLDFMPGVFSALTRLQKAGFTLVMISNQDGLGTPAFPMEDFQLAHDYMLKVFASQHIVFDDILICPHLPDAHCLCRKPNIGLLEPYLLRQSILLKDSYVIGDRDSDIQLANRLNVTGLQIGTHTYPDWQSISRTILDKPRIAHVERQTQETRIQVEVNLDSPGKLDIQSGIGFFDHMLAQLCKHAGISATIKCQGDVHIDDHHSVEDIGIALGTAFRDALGDKRGIERFAYLLPMDETQTQIALDLSGRAYCQCKVNFTTSHLGQLATEMIPHFFFSFAQSLQATLHIQVSGHNNHHMAESMFKGVGRTLATAMSRQGDELPSTKGVL